MPYIQGWQGPHGEIQTSLFYSVRVSQKHKQTKQKPERTRYHFPVKKVNSKAEEKKNRDRACEDLASKG